MGLFDIFKRKVTDIDTISFEKLLEKAADNPAYRVEFYKRLLNEKLFVITKDGEIPNGTTTVEKDTKISLFTFENKLIPIFTSTDRIFDKNVIKHQVNFLELKAEDLFGFTQGSDYILNPYSDYGKELKADEISRLIDGTLLSSKAQHLEIKKDTAVQIGQPTKYPDKAIKALQEFYASNANVKKAYLGWIYMPASSDPPHYIFAIEAYGDWSTISNQTGFIVKECLSPNEIIDLVKIGQSGLDSYFINNVKPFYVAN